MDQTARFQETLRWLAIFDETYAKAGSTFDPAGELPWKPRPRRCSS
jgi:hypothetical protein